LVNEKLSSLKDLTEDKQIPIGTMVKLTNGKQILLSSEEGSFLITVTLTNE